MEPIWTTREIVQNTLGQFTEISSNTAKYIFETQCKLNINDVEIIACKLKLFKNPIIDFINQEISAEREK